MAERRNSPSSACGGGPGRGDPPRALVAGAVPLPGHALQAGKGNWRAVLTAGIAAFACLAASVPAAGQTLQEALAMAYATNPQLLSERARLRATDEQVAQALSGWRPTVQITGTGGLSRQSSNTTGGGAPATVTTAGGTTALGAASGSGTQILRSHSYELSISQPLYRGGRTAAQTAQAENLVRAERATLAATEQSVLLNAAVAFVAVLRDQALLDLQIDNEQILRGQLQASQAQYRAGTALETDVQLAQSRLSTATAARQTAEGNLASSRETFQQVVGQAPQRLVAPTAWPSLPTRLADVKELAATVNPAVVAAQFTRAAAQDAVRVVRGQLLPQVSLNGAASRNVVSQSSERATDDLEVTAQVTMPLYEGGIVYSQSREAQQTVAQRTHDLDTARRQAVQTAGVAWDALLSARASIASNRDAVRAEEAALRGIQAQYRAGTRSIIDLLNEQQVLLNNRLNLVTAQYNEANAVFQLASAVGRFNAIDLNLPADLYDPNSNYEGVREKWIGFGTPE
jgi:outer membrane protein